MYGKSSFNIMDKFLETASLSERTYNEANFTIG